MTRTVTHATPEEIAHLQDLIEGLEEDTYSSIGERVGVSGSSISSIMRYPEGDPQLSRTLILGITYQLENGASSINLNEARRHLAAAHSVLTREKEKAPALMAAGLSRALDLLTELRSLFEETP